MLEVVFPYHRRDFIDCTAFCAPDHSACGCCIKNLRLACSADKDAVSRIAVIRFVASPTYKHLGSAWDSLNGWTIKTRSVPALITIYIVGIFDFLAFGGSGFFLSTAWKVSPFILMTFGSNGVSLNEYIITEERNSLIAYFFGAHCLPKDNILRDLCSNIVTGMIFKVIRD